MFWKKNEKLETLKDLIGSRAAYIETVKMLELEGIEKDIFLRASIEIKKKKPDMEIIDKAYAILIGKSFQGEPVANEVNSNENIESNNYDNPKQESSNKYSQNSNGVKNVKKKNINKNILKYLAIIIPIVVIIIFALQSSAEYNRVTIGKPTIIEYTYQGGNRGTRIIRNIKIDITNNYANTNDRDIKVTIKNLGFDLFILNDDQIYQMSKDSIVKNGGMYTPSKPRSTRIEIPAGETKKFYIDVRNSVDKIYIKKPNEENGIKTVLTLDVPPSRK